ncbi:MAG: ribosome small subunit-dependent GTPase A [Clostridiales bacterium]|nr:ribosome small subunit-dependent GTPase A [Clostridiales bacterium]
MKKGIVLKGINGFFYVDTGEGIFACRARGKLRHKDQCPVAGDVVSIEILPDKTGYLMEIMPRKNILLRPAVSNLDNLFIVASSADPVTDPFLIDKVLVIANCRKIHAVICINKCDLDNADHLFSIYCHSGIPVIRVSAETGEGIDRINEFIHGKVSAFTGNSGVGKSSIINQIHPEIQLETGELSEKIGRGCHTTRKVELIKLDSNTYIADTPGFSSFDLAKMDFLSREDLENSFHEFADYLGGCRFNGCSHTKEKGCAILGALEQGRIHQSRYQSYLRLYESVKDIKEWEK